MTKGIYIDDSEYIPILSGGSRNAAPRLNVFAALIEGENSGEPQPFDVTAFKKRMRAAHG